MAMPPGDYPLGEHPDVPTALVYATEDEFFEPAFERFMARELLGIDPIEPRGRPLPDGRGSRRRRRADGPPGARPGIGTASSSRLAPGFRLCQHIAAQLFCRAFSRVLRRLFG